MASISTIKLSASESGALSYQQAMEISIYGNMDERNKLGIIHDIDTLHKTHRSDAKEAGIAKQLQFSKPIYNTGHVTLDSLKNLENALLNANNQKQAGLLHAGIKNQANSTAKNNQDIFPIMMSSSHATANQSMKKPVDKKKPKKDTLVAYDNMVHDISELELLSFWEYEKQHAQS